MEVSKIHLSSAEIDLMQNAEIILTKNRVLEKIKKLLEGVLDRQAEFVNLTNLNHEMFNLPPKISKGENYLGLPYLILDYPRYASGKNFFFIRTMFWWGNFFSSTLQLDAGTKESFKQTIKQSYPQLKNYFISAINDPWIHHLNEPEFRKIDSLTKVQFEELCESLDHIKIAVKYSLSEWEKISSVLFTNWKFYLSLCGLIS